MSMASVSAPTRFTLSTRATTAFAFTTAVSFSVASSAPTPLYHIYQESLGLSALLITVVFASYAFAMMGAFLTVARLSDYVGRRPMILTALLLNAAALLLFAAAGSAGMLILARVVQGVATGIALTTLGATIIDTDPQSGPTYNSLTAFIGLMLGALLSGVLVSFAPLPTTLVYLVLLAVTLAEAVALAVVPETHEGRQGALTVLKPHLTVPVAARRAMLRVTPLTVAGWALGGFYLSLMPSLVVAVTGVRSPLLGAAVVAVVMLGAAAGIFALRRFSPAQAFRNAVFGLLIGIAVTLAGVALGSAPVMIVGTAIAGFGFGPSFSVSLRILLPLAGGEERAGLLAAFFILSYVAFSVPAIIAGLVVPVLGLVTTSYIYGGVLIGFAALSLVLNTEEKAPRLG